MRHFLRRAAGLAALALWGCAPTLDWREVRPPGSRAQALFPCNPASHVRSVKLAGAAVEMSLYACSAGTSAYALAFADVRDPALVTPALVELAQAARDKLQAAGNAASAPLSVPGMTPNVQAAMWRLQGRLPDGRPALQQLALFAHATQVYQVSAVGADLDAQAMDSFFGALRLAP